MSKGVRGKFPPREGKRHTGSSQENQKKRRDQGRPRENGLSAPSRGGRTVCFPNCIGTVG